MDRRKEIMTQTDMVNHPPHYNAYSIEVIEVTRHCSFNIGNAIKYMLRHLHKGTSQQDLEKALWYIDDYIKTWPSKQTLIPNPSARTQLFTLTYEYRNQEGMLLGVYEALRFIGLDRIDLAREQLAMVL